MPVRLYALPALIAPLLLWAALTVPARAEVGDAARKAEEAHSWLGSYLAGRQARKTHDVPAAAAFYAKVLQKDPDNAAVLDAAFHMEAAQGNWPRAEALARALVVLQPSNRLAQTFLGIVAFKAGRHAEAEAHFKGPAVHPVGDLTNALARAWIAQAQGKSDEALSGLDAQKLPDWTTSFVRYHRALLADVAGRAADARATYGQIPKVDQTTLRVALAFAASAANAGDTKLAQGVLLAHLEKSRAGGHPQARALLAEIEAGKRPQLLVGTASEGMSELFFGLGELLASDSGSLGVGVIFLQFSIYLNPNSTFSLVALAGTHEMSKRHGEAIATYDRIPKGTPLEVAVEINKALNLAQLKKVDEAQSLLEAIGRKHPRDIRPLESLGAIMRASNRFAEAVDYYTKAIALIGKPDARHWAYFYARGASYERLKKLPQAEADLQRSLRLSPDQPDTLNYLGYTWVDNNRYLKKGLQLIEKAVKLKPDNGFIVDSLGWAHYRLGNFQLAVKHLEQAVTLRPDDPTLNDHLGDAYWRVGREREARFQWTHALALKPEPADAEKMREKLEKGLPAPKVRQVRRSKDARRAERTRRRSDDDATSAEK
jgi:tetratricopeptide (TPR) repeat protein